MTAVDIDSSQLSTWTPASAGMTVRSFSQYNPDIKPYNAISMIPYRFEPLATDSTNSVPVILLCRGGRRLSESSSGWRLTTAGSVAAGDGRISGGRRRPDQWRPATAGSVAAGDSQRRACCSRQPGVAEPGGAASPLLLAHPQRVVRGCRCCCPRADRPERPRTRSAGAVSV
jgi:hypothetical protein